MRSASAGLLLYRQTAGRLEVLLVHPGGPYFARRDAGSWSIPKGEVRAGESPLAAARREFAEETSLELRVEEFVPLGTIRQRGGKVVHGWAACGDCDPAAVRSNAFELEWPPGSGRRQTFPEIDRAAWFDPPAARAKLNPAQVPFVDRLESHLTARRGR